MPQLVKQKTGLSDTTQDHDFQTMCDQFNAGYKAVVSLSDDLKKYRAALDEWSMYAGSTDSDYASNEGPSNMVEECKMVIDNELVQVLQEYAAVMKNVEAKIIKRNHKLLDYDRHRATIKSLQEKKNRTVSEERSMIRAEEAFQQAQTDYEQFNQMLKEELPVLLDLQRQLLQPVYAKLLDLQKTFFRHAHQKHLSQPQNKNIAPRTRPASIVREFEDDAKRWFDGMGECQNVLGKLSMSRIPSSGSIASNVSTSSYANKPLPMPNKPSIEQLVSDMQKQAIEDNSMGNAKDSQLNVKKAVPPPPYQTAISNKPKQPETVVALYDFDAQQPGDLSFKKGDKITILMKTEHSNDWWRGRNMNTGKEGMFPGNYVTIFLL